MSQPGRQGRRWSRREVLRAGLYGLGAWGGQGLVSGRAAADTICPQTPMGFGGGLWNYACIRCPTPDYVPRYMGFSRQISPLGCGIAQCVTYSPTPPPPPPSPQGPPGKSLPIPSKGLPFARAAGPRRMRFEEGLTASGLDVAPSPDFTVYYYPFATNGYVPFVGLYQGQVGPRTVGVKVIYYWGSDYYFPLAVGVEVQPVDPNWPTATFDRFMGQHFVVTPDGSVPYDVILGRPGPP